MTGTMTHRQRVVTALAHKEPDRVPLDLGSNRATTMTVGAYERLKAHLGIEADNVVVDRMQQIVAVDKRILKRFDIDVCGVRLGGPDQGGDVEVGPYSYRDEWGVERVRPPGSYYYDLQRCPLAGPITLKDIVRYPWPDPHDPGRIRGLRQEVERLRRETDCAIVLALPAGFVHVSQYLRGFEDWFADLALEPRLAEALFDAVLEVNLAIMADALEEVGDLIDVAWTSDDVAMQRGPLLSPEMYRRTIKPRHRRVFDLIHSRTRAPAMYHSCGSLYAILEDLIEIGVDGINPVQVSAADMDTARLKREFGDRLIFWGGIDTQRVLPYGTPEEVREEVRRRIRDLAPGGGYVVNSVHNIQPDVPPENVCALFDSARDLGRYGAA